jgi:hypothetical protein
MARPKLDDPTVPISFRMKRSASEWWTAKAVSKGTTVPKLIRRVLVEKASRSGKVTYDAGGGLEVELETGPSQGFPDAGRSRILGPVPSTSNVSPEVEESLRDLSKDIAEQTRQELPKHLERKGVEPRFKKGGKK